MFADYAVVIISKLILDITGPLRDFMSLKVWSSPLEYLKREGVDVLLTVCRSSLLSDLLEIFGDYGICLAPQALEVAVVKLAKRQKRFMKTGRGLIYFLLCSYLSLDVLDHLLGVLKVLTGFTRETFNWIKRKGYHLRDLANPLHAVLQWRKYAKNCDTKAEFAVGNIAWVQHISFVAQVVQG